MTTTKRLIHEPVSAGPAVFRDTFYISRVLILPDGRQLAVAQGRVCADPQDAVALDYLNNHPDLQPQE